MKAILRISPFQDCTSRETVQALKRLVALFGLGIILGTLGDFLESGFLSPAQAGLARQAQYQVLQDLRPEAVALVDAFAIPDYVLDSSLGRYDGDVYRYQIPPPPNPKLPVCPSSPSAALCKIEVDKAGLPGPGCLLIDLAVSCASPVI